MSRPKVRIESVDAEAGTWSVPEKRVRTNRKNLVEFFQTKDKHERDRFSALELLDPDTFRKLARLYLAHEAELEAVFSYARRFKQAAGEITDEDLAVAECEISVKRVMES